MNAGHESNSSIESYFQHLLSPFVCSFMKVIAPSRFTFSIYYPRWVRRCNSLVGHEGNRSIEIYFQYLLSPLPLFYCFTCLWLVFFLCRMSSASRTFWYNIFLMRYFSPFSSSLVNTPLKVRLGFRCAFLSIHFCFLHVLTALLRWNSIVCNQSSIDIQVVCTNYCETAEPWLTPARC